MLWAEMAVTERVMNRRCSTPMADFRAVFMNCETGKKLVVRELETQKNVSEIGEVKAWGGVLCGLREREQVGWG